MKSKSILSLAQCREMANAAEDEAVRMACIVSIAIVDDGGHLLLQIRMDGASPMSGHVAPSKARMSAYGRRETRLLEEMVNGGRMGLLSSSMLEGMIEGGVPLIFEDQCIGAVGVSGAKPDEDTRIARAAVAAFGP
jgi:uncharacterized protein GlcG (DUF336 family)